MIRTVTVYLSVILCAFLLALDGEGVLQHQGDAAEPATELSSTIH